MTTQWNKKEIQYVFPLQAQPATHGSTHLLGLCGADVVLLGQLRGLQAGLEHLSHQVLGLQQGVSGKRQHDQPLYHCLQVLCWRDQLRTSTAPTQVQQQ
jgi:hypothetical protein